LSGCVYLVGAGPGDPKLLTLRAKECLEHADIVFYDALANPAVLRWAPETAERIFVGKRSGDHAVPQDDMNVLLVKAAQSGKTVVRLKGGDPFVFGRGGEEAEELRQAGIAFEIVPGVTSPVAATAYAGIPLTHRDYASSVAFVTGHEDPTKPAMSVRWRNLAQSVDTIAILMGVGNLPGIVAELVAGGKSPDTPAAAVQWGTTPKQRAVVATLGTLADEMVRVEIGSPAIIVIGGVAQLRERLAWFDARPLFGRRVVVTRARDQASSLVELLTERGAEVIEFPTIRTEAPESYAELDDAIASLETFDWIVFASANGVEHFWARLVSAGKDARAFGSARVVAIGPATQASLAARGIVADFVPAQSRSEAVLAEFDSVRGLRMLLPRAEEGRDVLRAGWTEAGANVVAPTAYRTVPVTSDADEVRALLEAREIDAVTFTSGSTVEHFSAAIRASGFEPSYWLADVCVATIGPITTTAAQRLGVPVTVEASSANVEAVVEALVAHFAARR